ncbi:hypothetical protein KQX63_21720 [Rhodopseudomonas palustris]|uniref:hypothetical protein n=1 Tax=Rhodopseudomonas palustris TaxID=1076 RepID=UPI0021F3994B|nr:hypothetical protein [Rhodopseudomonas palustris]UYO43960.1 hypothetical protein KQX63_21720 [Rhodopseudomonas palustris]
MKYQVSDHVPARFDHDFDLVPAAGVVPTAAERDLLGQIETAVEVISAGRKADDAARLCPALAEARRRWWFATAAQLREAAEHFASTQNVDLTLERVATIDAERRRSEPDIVIESIPVAEARFAKEFRVDPRRCPLGQPDQDYLTALNEVLDVLAADVKKEKKSDGSPRYSDAVLRERAIYREAAADELREDAINFRKGTPPVVLASNARFINGKYRGLVDRLGGRLFAVNIKYEKRDGKDVAVDLKIGVNEGLPPPNDTPSVEKQDLYVQIDNAMTVIGAVCRQLEERTPVPYRVDAIAAAKQRARSLLDEYVRKLAGIAGLGLEGPHVDLAKKALIGLKLEFAGREAGRIKNDYVRRLGAWAALFFIGFLVAYAAIRSGTCSVTMMKEHAAQCPSPWWNEHKTFLLAAAGASLGTWLSFAIRRLDLPFDDLALLDEHSLDPPFRIAFVVALTLMACLLFWTGALNIEIGNLKTGSESFKATGSVALVVGLFCGLSERALATAMSNRGAAFIAGLAGR